MQRIDGRMIYSATDLNDFLECAHLCELERLVARNQRTRPEADPSIELLARKGAEHEARYLESLRAQYGTSVVVGPARTAPSILAWEEAQAATLAAMSSGAQIIYQAAFFDGSFIGRADFLRRVERPSLKWAWSYEVIDTKLGLSPKPHYLVQLCNYSEHLERLQGTPPHDMHVVLGSDRERSFHVADFAAYYRHVKSSFLSTMARSTNSTYPLENPHCSACAWSATCAKQRDSDDHLSLVASIKRSQIARLESNGIATLAALAAATPAQRPVGMAESTFEKLHAQAALQHVQRTEQRYAYELLEPRENVGFSAIPAPDVGDIFFDMEGDPLYRADRGLEYLFGAYLPHENEYRAFWARSDRDEYDALCAFMDFVQARLQQYPHLHIYHYAPYEVTALKRLAGRFGAREELIDSFLKRAIFVDLYAVVRNAVRISQPSYSIKKLEAFYGMTRSTRTKRGDDSILMFETWLMNGDDAILEDIERYNEDDCRSTWLLRDWLLMLRAERNRDRDEPIPFRKPPLDDDGTDAESPRTELEGRLLNGIDAIESGAALRAVGDTVRARWLLGHMLQFHRRDQKPDWWRYFERIQNPDDLLEGDSDALAGLRLRSDVPSYKLNPKDKNFVYTYDFPPQDHHLRSKALCAHTTKSVEIVRIDDRTNTALVKANASVAAQLRALIPQTPPPDRVKRAAMERIAHAHVAAALQSEHPATYDLLLAHRPRIDGATAGAPIQPTPVSADAVASIVKRLRSSSLFVQGPPGSGKSTLGAHVIVDLIAAGKRVGIVANGHKSLHHLLHTIEAQALARGITIHGVHKASTQTEGSQYDSLLDSPMITTVYDKADVPSDWELVSGTTYMWAETNLVDVFDYLIIEEAGQVALADALNASLAARNIVLLGDPQQLPQVSQGTHPTGSGSSILEHLLGDAETVSPERGIFLDTSYRMHPAICAFVSNAIYDGRLHSAPLAANNRIDSPGLNGAGLRYLPIEHAGNSRYAIPEAERIVAEVEKLLRGSYVRNDEPSHPITAHDILVVTPYNLQRNKIAEMLETAGYGEVRVGTVDKFQGQEAPIVFYSMATSSGADMPRDLTFLFDTHRFNVAISRAQCMTVLVCSPELLDTRATTTEAMKLVNLLCSYVESASTA